MHFARGCSRIFQYASTGIQVNTEVKIVVMPQATQIPITMCTGMRIERTVKMRLY